jgi:hypothetical protein
LQEDKFLLQSVIKPLGLEIMLLIVIVHLLVTQFQSHQTEFQDTAAFLLYSIFKLNFLITGKDAERFEYVSATEISLINSEDDSYDGNVRHGFQAMDKFLRKGMSVDYCFDVC